MGLGSDAMAGNSLPTRRLGGIDSQMHYFDQESLSPGVIGPCAVAVGTFDGVHLGHQKLIETMVARARFLGLRAVVLTFEPHPAEVFGRSGVARLTTPAEKRSAIAACGPEYCVCIRFSREFAGLSSEDFVRKWLVETLDARAVFVGFNFHFGKNAGGSPSVLRELAKRWSLDLTVLEPLEMDGKALSSTRIRETLSLGRAADAASMLGHAYVLKGRVVPGEGRGKGLGFPTANIDIDDPRKLVPSFGVYKGHVSGKQLGARLWSCLVSIGLSPTFGVRDLPRFEVFIPGQNQSLYGAELVVHVEEWIRSEMKFASVEDLIARMRDDLAILSESAGEEGKSDRIPNMEEVGSNGQLR